MRHGHIHETPSSEKMRERVVSWSQKIGVSVKQIHVREMRNKWASCSTAGRITLDAKVAELPKDLCDYVIVHELLHLRIPNHGKLWKSFMRVYLGDWEKLEKSLAGAK